MKKQSLHDKLLAESEHLRALNPNGLLVPDDVVDFARNPNTAWHSQFEWDDTKAAHQFRLVRARTVIRVLVVYEQNTGQPIKGFVSLVSQRQQPRGGYDSTINVLSNEETREELLADALSELRRVQAKYSMLAELADVFAAIDAVNVKAKARQARKAKAKSKSKSKAKSKAKGASAQTTS
jgi:ribosome-associated translation inhibitor RaiA